MRPSADAFGRPRTSDKDDFDGFHLAPNVNTGMTFYLGREESIDAALEQPTASASRILKGKAPVLTSTDRDESAVADDDVNRPETPRSQAHTFSAPLTPVMMGTSGPASSTLSIASSRRGSLDGSVLGELPSGMASGGASVSAEAASVQASEMMDSGSAPQLIMPSIKMPSRRPFTAEGKAMGRLKVLIAGDSGK
jgi:hypothetical protein